MRVARNPVKKITKPMLAGGKLAYTSEPCEPWSIPLPARLNWNNVRGPNLADGEEEIAIEVAGVCGSDISGFLGHSALRRPPLVLGHELVGRRRDGRRVVANPLLSCGHCDACLSGAQNLCESWKLLGLGTTPGRSPSTWRCPPRKSTKFPIRSLRNRQFWLSRWRTLSTCFGLFRRRPSSAWRLWARGRWVRSPCSTARPHRSAGRAGHRRERPAP